MQWSCYCGHIENKSQVVTIPRKRLTPSTVFGSGIYTIALIFEANCLTLFYSVVWTKTSILFPKNVQFEQFKCKLYFLSVVNISDLICTPQ